jgi:hypothetical protein
MKLEPKPFVACNGVSMQRSDENDKNETDHHFPAAVF